MISPHDDLEQECGLCELEESVSLHWLAEEAVVINFLAFANFPHHHCSVITILHLPVIVCSNHPHYLNKQINE